jgi:hypothetical protein
MADVDGLGDLAETEPIVALNIQNSFGAIGIDGGKPSGEIVPGDILPVDPERGLSSGFVQDFENNCIWIWRHGSLKRGPGQLRRFAFGNGRNDHHEYDEEDEQDVDHGRDVDLRVH